jgi:hypothetical protein
MKRKPRTPSDGDTDTTDILADTLEYLRTWAKELVTTAGKREARLALAEYRRIAADKRVPKADRKIAADHAKVLREFL